MINLKDLLNENIGEIFKLLQEGKLQEADDVLNSLVQQIEEMK
jgi:hypothetical protein